MEFRGEEALQTHSPTRGTSGASFRMRASRSTRHYPSLKENSSAECGQLNESRQCPQRSSCHRPLDPGRTSARQPNPLPPSNVGAPAAQSCDHAAWMSEHRAHTLFHKPVYPRSPTANWPPHAQQRHDALEENPQEPFGPTADEPFQRRGRRFNTTLSPASDPCEQPDGVIRLASTCIPLPPRSGTSHGCKSGCGPRQIRAPPT